MFAAPALLLLIGVVFWGVLLVTGTARASVPSSDVDDLADPSSAPDEHHTSRAGEAGRNDDDPVVWHFEQLVRLGVDPVTALGASLAGVDYAAVRSLVERGCPATLALVILAPDENAVAVGRDRPAE